MYTYRTGIIFPNTEREEREVRGIDLIFISTRAEYTERFYPNSFYFGSEKVLPILFTNSIKKKRIIRFSPSV